MNISFTDKGIAFRLESNDLHFPLDQAAMSHNADWQQLNEAEQLWYEGLLRLDCDTDAYLLSNEDFYRLDEESQEIFGFTQPTPRLKVSETGNIASGNYRINWSVLVNGRDGGRKQRTGVLVHCAEREYLLSERQYRLVTMIDSFTDAHSAESRGSFFSQVKLLAQRAEAEMDRFMVSRDFCFVDDVALDVQKVTSRELRITPAFTSLPTDVADCIDSKTLKGTNQLRHNGKRTTVFASPKARQEYDTVLAMSPIRGKQVPEFLDNPLPFLPDSIVDAPEFNPEEFSARVRGLDIRKARAVPYVHIEPTAGEPGWLDVNTGYNLESDYWDETSGENTTPKTVFPELQQLMEQAAASGERYVYYDDQWIKIDPQVVSNFAKANRELVQSSGGRIKEASRTMILDIYDNLNGMEYNEGLIADLVSAMDQVRVTQPPEYFCGKLHDYQQEGYTFLKAHFENNSGVLLADDMGTGKTIQVIAFLSYLYSEQKLDPTMIVVPKSLVDNWVSEIHKFMPKTSARYTIYVHQGSNRYRNAEMVKQNDIVLTTYETLARDQTMMGRIQWNCIICDEVQKIKNFRTVAASALKGMNTRCRIGMTGTPVENHLNELWSIVDFVQPGLLDSYQHFRKTYEIPIEREEFRCEELIDALVNKMSPVFLRRTKEDVLAEKLPEKHEESIALPIDSITDAMYRDLVREAKQQQEDAENAQGIILSVIQKLMMLCSHPRLISKQPMEAVSVDTLIAESPKLQWTVDKMEEIFARGEKVILFTKYKKMQALLRRVIAERFGIDAPIINGEVTGDRLAVVHGFSARPGSGAIILSPRAAGVGLTITAANHVIHYTREWNPAVENQATDRAYRIGQQKDVYVYYPILVSQEFLTAEAKLDALLETKRGLMKSVVIPMGLEITVQDMESVLEL